MSSSLEDDVILPTALREVLFRVIDDMIGAQQTNHVGVGRATNSSNFRLEGLRDLNREHAHATGRAHDQDSMAGSNFSTVAKRLQCREGRSGYHCGLFEGETERLSRKILRRRTGVFSECSLTRSEYSVARSKLRHVLAN